MTNISFTGDIVPAICQCHIGKFVARAFVVDPVHGQMPIAHTFFDTEAEAEQHLDGFVFSVADDHLKKMGLSVDQAKTVTVVHGDEAVKSLRKTINETHPQLH